MNTQYGLYDVNVADFPRLEGETGDSARIMRAVAAAGKKGVVLFPRGNYEIDKMLVVDNGVSLLMHKSARLSAVCEMPFVLKYQGGVHEPGCPWEDDRSQFITGGEIDGRGIANCANVMGVKHITLSHTNFRNGKGIGLKLGDCDLPADTSAGYEIIAHDLYFRCDMPDLGVNTAIINLLSDSHYTDIVTVNYTYGIQTWGGCNRFTRCHFWGWGDRVRNSVAFDNWGLDTIYSECYADTAETGFWIRGDATLANCTGCNHPKCPMDNPVWIRHEAGSLIVSGSRFSKNLTRQIPYVRGEKAGELIWRDNIVRGMAGGAAEFTDEELAELRSAIALNAKPKTRSTKPKTRNVKRETRNAKPKNRTRTGN